MKARLKVLLIGRCHSTQWVLPSMLSRAGFLVDVLTSSSLMRYSKYIRNHSFVHYLKSLLPVIKQKLKENYDWVVITDDGTLKDIAFSDLPIEDKLKLLPVLKEENFIHLFSKIGLSKVFLEHQVNTPPFFIAPNQEEIILRAEGLGYPFLVKLDSSSGGCGVFECKTQADVTALPDCIFEHPLLIQKKIEGDELDLSALFFEGKLVHFNYAKVERCCTKFGPSSVRTYFPLSEVKEEVFLELSQIGKALGANGFVNIGCIQAKDKRWYFEADMRPNAWVEIPRYFGEDPAIKIFNWFSHKAKLSYPALVVFKGKVPILISYFLRLNKLEVLFNRYKVWNYIPRDDPYLLWRLIIQLMCTFGLKKRVAQGIKSFIPKKYHARCRRVKNYILYGVS